MSRLTRHKLLPPLLLLITAFIFGISFSAQKAASAIPTFTLVALRGLIAALFLLLILPLTDKLQSRAHAKPRFRIERVEWLGGAISGGLLALASILQQAGIGEGTDAGKASFITALYIVIVPILGLLFGKRPRWNVWVSVALATLGFFLLCIDGAFRLAPSDLSVLLCSFVFAAQILVIDRFAPQGDGVRISCVQFLTSGIISAALAIIFESPISINAIAAYLPQLFYLGIVASGIGYTLQIVGQQSTPPTAASLILSLESVFGALGAAMLLGESLLPKELLGCAAVFLAVILAQLTFKKQ